MKCHQTPTALQRHHNVQSDSSHLLINSNVIGTCCLQPQYSEWIFYQNFIKMLDFITV